MIRPDEILDKAARLWFRRRVRNREFCVISNDCWGSAVYPALGLPYRTPFVGLFLVWECYWKLLSNFQRLIRAPLQFTTQSRYPWLNERRAGDWETERRSEGFHEPYPIGVLDNQVEIHFLHYASQAEASSKWERRRARFNFENENQLFVRYGSPDEVVAPKEMQFFDSLPFRHKTVFVGTPVPSISCAVWIPAAEGTGRIPRNLFVDRLLFRNPYFDMADWLNGRSGRPHGAYRLIMNRFLRPKELPPLPSHLL